MSLDLADLKRLKITQETAAWLEVEHRRTGKKKAEIVRELLHKMAVEQIDAARLLLAIAPRQGNGGERGDR